MQCSFHVQHSGYSCCCTQITPFSISSLFMSERTYFTTSQRIFAAPVTPSLQLFYSLHLCFQDFPTSNTSSIGVLTLFLFFFSFSFMFLGFVPQWLSNFPEYQQLMSMTPALHLHSSYVPHTHRHSFIPSIISTSFNMKSGFQVRLIIFGSELEK